MSDPHSHTAPPLEALQKDNPVAARLIAIHAQLDEACKQAGRDVAGIHITAVSKKHTVSTIRRALDAGHRLFGENRVQEAMEKWPTLRADFPDVSVRLIGPLQSNKAADAVSFFDVIETIDREKIAKALANEITKQGRSPSLFVQVNTGEEPQKAGVVPSEIDAFIALCRKDFGLTISGLMCIPPVDDAPAPHFALLKNIADRNGVDGLSMGMSGDYEIAAQLGATHVRIGTGIFGPRPS